MKTRPISTTWLLIATVALTIWAASVGATGWAIAAAIVTVAAAGIAIVARVRR